MHVTIEIYDVRRRYGGITEVRCSINTAEAAYDNTSETALDYCCRDDSEGTVEGNFRLRRQLHSSLTVSGLRDRHASSMLQKMCIGLLQ